MNKIKVYNYMIMYTYEGGTGRIFLSLPNRGLEENVSFDDVRYLDDLIKSFENPKLTNLFVTNWKLLSVEELNFFDFQGAYSTYGNFKIGDFVISNRDMEGLTKDKVYEIIPSHSDWGYNKIAILNDNKEVKLYNTDCFNKNIKELSIKEIYKLAKEKSNVDTLPMSYIIRFFKNTKEAYNALGEALDEGVVEKVEYTECSHCKNLDVFDENNMSDKIRCSHCGSYYLADIPIEKFKLINSDTENIEKDIPVKEASPEENDGGNPFN